MQIEADKPKDKPSCPKCGNRLRVLPDQVGTMVRCPKCNATFVLGGAAKAKARPAAKARQKPAEAPALDDEAYLPQIPKKPATIIPEDPVRLAPETRGTIVPQEPRTLAASEPAGLPIEETGGLNPESDEVGYEVDWSTVDDLETEKRHERSEKDVQLHLESARRRGLVRDYDFLDPPRWTFFSGVFGYPWRGVNLTRWTAMAFGFSLSALISLKALDLMGLLGGDLSRSAILGILLGVVAIGLTLATLSFAAVSCRAAIQDTADGHDLPQDGTLPEWDMWVLTFLAWFSLWTVGGILGYPLSLAIGPLAFVISSAVFFPILLLSAMECESYFVPFSPPVLRTLRDYPHGWLMFYLLTTAMFAAWVVAFDFAFPHAPYATVFLSGPLLAAILLVYARLLGRLAWRASGMPMARIEHEEPLHTTERKPAAEPSSKRPGKRKKKRRTIRIEIPDESAPADEREPPPRINFHLRP